MTQKGSSVLLVLISLSIVSLLTFGAFFVFKNYPVKTAYNQQAPTTDKIVEKPSPSVSNSSLPEQTRVPSTTPSNEVISTENELKFTGTISATSNECWMDGNCSLTVDGKVIFVAGGLTPNSKNTPKGKLIGYNYSKDTAKYIGKKAEVYAKVLNNNFLTIDGSEKYYVKVLDN